MFIAIGYLPPSLVPLKIRMIVGALIAAAGTLLFVFADGESFYWKLVAPGMFIGSFGESVVRWLDSNRHELTGGSALQVWRLFSFAPITVSL